MRKLLRYVSMLLLVIKICNIITSYVCFLWFMLQILNLLNNIIVRVVVLAGAIGCDLLENGVLCFITAASYAKYSYVFLSNQVEWHTLNCEVIKIFAAFSTRSGYLC